MEDASAEHQHSSFAQVVSHEKKENRDSRRSSNHSDRQEDFQVDGPHTQVRDGEPDQEFPPLQGHTTHIDPAWANANEFVPTVPKHNFIQAAEHLRGDLQNIIGQDFSHVHENSQQPKPTQEVFHGFQEPRQNDQSNVNQRRTYESVESSDFNRNNQQDGEQFRGGPPPASGRAAMHFSMPDQQQRDGVFDGAPLDSPMGEFDMEKRRRPSLGPNVGAGGGNASARSASTSSGRRSRPLNVHVRDLVFWRNLKDSGVLFGFGLVLLLSLSYFSIISIFAYVSMALLICVTTFILIKQVIMAFQQQQSEHPFKALLEKDVVISPDYAHQQLDNLLKPCNSMLMRIRNLYLADSLGQTLKFIFIMYLMTYVGSCFNLLTLLTIIWVGAFTVPKFYVTYKEQIDSVLDVVLESLRDLKLQASRAVNKQINKITSRRGASVAVGGAEGKIKARASNGHEKVEAELKTDGTKISMKHEKKGKAQ